MASAGAVLALREAGKTIAPVRRTVAREAKEWLMAAP